MNAAHKILVVYYSMTGNTARVAHDIARRLNADIESIQEKKHSGPLLSAWLAVRKKPSAIAEPLRNPSDYDLTIVGTPVWVGQMTPAVRAYLQRTGAGMRQAAFFVTSANTDVARVRPALQVLSRHTAVACSGFNAHELRDAAVYENKLAAFVGAIQSAIDSTRAPVLPASAA